MGNTRGSTWSRKHISIDPDAKEFWDFSWHEIGVHDITAMIDFILQTTGQAKLFYIGHSQGATGLLVALSEIPDYNAKLYAAFLMTVPVILVKPSPLLTFLKTNSIQIEVCLFELFQRRGLIID